MWRFSITVSATLAAGCLAPTAARHGGTTIIVTTEGAPRADAKHGRPEVIAPLAARDLPAPHRHTTPEPAVRSPDDLRALVGRRDKRVSVTAVLAWAHALKLRVPDATSGGELVSLPTVAARTTIARPGDLLVFDHTEGELADLVAIAIARDDRGVTEFVYVAAGIVRRGFVDPKRPKMRRDADARVVNTFLRAGKRWPPKGTRYLAGELLAHVIPTH